MACSNCYHCRERDEMRAALVKAREVVEALATKYYSKLNEWKYEADFGYPRHVLAIIDAALSHPRTTDQQWLLDSAVAAASVNSSNHTEKK